jgi:hypothetical protein
VNAFGLSPLWVTALLLAVAAIVTGLYLLKPAPRRIVIASTLIWERVLHRKRRDAERWRWWLSLLLSLSIALLIACAIARPDTGQTGAAGRRVVIVVDDSPSMGTLRSDGRTRLEHALEEARRAIGAGGAAGRTRVVDTMGALGDPAFEDRRRALAALDRVPADARGNPRFPETARADAATGDPQVLFITDGVAAVDVPKEVQVLSVFEPAPNVGITAFDVRAWPGDPRRHEALVAVTNAGSAAANVRVTIAGAAKAPIERALDVQPGAMSTLSVTLPDFAGGPVRASVRSDGDSFAADDVAYAFLPVAKVAKVALVTPGNRALEQALRLDPRVVLTVLTPRQYATRAGFDAYVLDRFAPSSPPAAPALLIRPPKQAWLPAIGATRTAPVVESWLDGHPVLDGVSLRDVQIERAETFEANGSSVIGLARDAGGAALIAASAASPRWIVSGFAIEDSNFAGQASFPMFVVNALAWLVDDPPAIDRPLGLVSVPVAQARVTGPGGYQKDTQFVPDATLFDADVPGVYAAEGEGGRLRVVANVLDAAVTGVNASRLPPQRVGTATAAAASSAPEPWIVLLLSAILLMLFEWWTYHRRITV